MFAKNLEYLLAECCRSSDVSPADPSEIAVRFNSLRAYGKLPRGREKRAQRLGPAEIASALFGLVPANPNWAGHAAIILSDLRPIGGIEASFDRAPTLAAAVQHLLSDSSARERLIALSLSLSEHGTNSNGYAVLTYGEAETQRHVAFVSKMAVSLLQPGAERDFDLTNPHAPVARAMLFTRPFFIHLEKAVQRALAIPEPAGNGSEYDTEEAEQARRRALGVTNRSRFLNIGVDTQVAWPSEERLVHFDKYDLVLMPRTKEHTQSIHIDLHKNRLTDQEAMTVAYRFLSILTWCDDQFAVAQGGWSGNPIPVAVPRRNLAFATADGWVFDRLIPSSDKTRRAVALYREGRNAEQGGLVSYAVLSYFKIIEIKHPDGPKAKRWIARNFPAVCASAQRDHDLQRFLAACGNEPPDEYIYKACRHAVAHASVKIPSDADDIEELRRLHSASYVLRQLARRLISQELCISGSVYSGD